MALTDQDRRILAAAMDRLVPPVDGLPGAGGMGLAEEVARLAGSHGPYGRSLAHILSELSQSAEDGFVTLDASAQDSAIRRVEAAHPVAFANLLEAVYLAYYSQPAVHARIGWQAGPLQPAGFALPPFEGKVLETVRQRNPFWRQTPDMPARKT